MKNPSSAPISIQETAIPVEQIPQSAKEYLFQQQGILEPLGFQLQLYLLRVFPSTSYQSRQWAVEMFDSSRQIIASILYLQRDMSFLTRLLSSREPVMRGRMFQTLFQDGSRLITTDLGSSAKQRERPSHIDWMDIGPEVSNLAALEIHQDRLELRKRERNIPCVQLQSFNDYRTFPEKFPHKGQ